MSSNNFSKLESSADDVMLQHKSNGESATVAKERPATCPNSSYDILELTLAQQRIDNVFDDI